MKTNTPALKHGLDSCAATERRLPTSLKVWAVGMMKAHIASATTNGQSAGPVMPCSPWQTRSSRSRALKWKVRWLECGAFKGSSTACLSLVCEELCFELDCADSFEGLPSEEGHYGKGDFLGTLDEVKKNVSRFGKLEHVNFVKGWYSETLKDYSKPLALLWIDVDLQESTIDVLRNVYSNLAPGAVIFSDGFSEDVDFIGNQIAHTGGEPAGFFRYFEENKINYCAAPGGSKGLAMIIPRESSDLDFVIPPKFISTIIERL